MQKNSWIKGSIPNIKLTREEEIVEMHVLKN